MGDETSALIFFGSFVLLAPLTFSSLCGRHSRDLDLSVDLLLSIVNAGYRRSPEHPLPTGFDECYAALKWFAEGFIPVQGSQNHRKHTCFKFPQIVHPTTYLLDLALFSQSPPPFL
ncbi:hypothetical protein DFH08DRAFT_483654 [Mycena albidolilacea]|uniref:Alpha/beta hydrolase fold-3 domain-containing protein n=1 Tax=Mycena albidolilacea TaxID=1033008 RepID=A0AAD6Z6M9_9AGAR|nr:hypothetical protein DFH08DRAFT_483654 [Mycena albidolilacea]